MRGQVTLTQFGYTASTLGALTCYIEPELKKRPWEPYKRQAIKVTGTIKSVKTDNTRDWGRREIRNGGFQEEAEIIKNVRKFYII